MIINTVTKKKVGVLGKDGKTIPFITDAEMLGGKTLEEIKKELATSDFDRVITALRELQSRLDALEGNTDEYIEPIKVAPIVETVKEIEIIVEEVE